MLRVLAPLLILTVMIQGQHVAWAQEFAIPFLPNGELRLSTGVDMSSGDYGDSEDTDILYVPFTVTYLLDGFSLTPSEGDQIAFRVVVPYVRIRGPGSVVEGSSGALPTRAVGSSDQTDEGLGDIILRTNYSFAPPTTSRLPFFEISGKVKIPTADEDARLGTGETDVTIEFTTSKRLGSFSPFATVGYSWMGDSSQHHLRNRRLASLGMSYRFSQRWSAGLIFDWREAASASAEDSRELVPYASIQLGRRLRLQPYGVVGLSDGSPNLGFGLQMRVSIPVQ